MDTCNVTHCKYLTKFIYVSKKYNRNISYYIYGLSLLHVLLLVFLQTTGKTVNNFRLTTIRYTQQKWHRLMSFENNGTLQKWHMINLPPEINNMTPTENGTLQIWHTFRKNSKD